MYLLPLKLPAQLRRIFLIFLLPQEGHVVILSIVMDHFYKALFDEIKKFGRSQKMMGIGARPQPILRPYFLSSGFTYFTVPPPFCECR